MTARITSSDTPHLAGLTWGIKRSFIRYIAMLPDGNYLTDEGACLGGTSYFTFPTHPASPNADPVTRFTGSLRIRGHGGMLDVLLADPWIEHRDNGMVLSVVDPNRWPGRDQRLVLAHVTPMIPDAPTPGEKKFTALLADSGTDVFGGQYDPGTPLDPVTVRQRLTV